MLARSLRKVLLKQVPLLPRCTAGRSVVSTHPAVRRVASTVARRTAAPADEESDWAADSPTDVVQIPIPQSFESEARRAASGSDARREALRERRAARRARRKEAQNRDAKLDRSADSPTDIVQPLKQELADSDKLSTSPLNDFLASVLEPRAASAEKPTGETAEEGLATEEILEGNCGTVQHSRFPHTELSPPKPRMLKIGVFGYSNYSNSPLKLVDGRKPIWDGQELSIGRRFGRDIFRERWLRDHCQCSQCFHPVTKQRQINIFTLKDEASFTISNCIVGDTNVEIDWQDGHHSHYPMHLFTVATGSSKEAYRRGLDMSPRLWNASVGKQAPAVDYDSVQRNGVGELLRQIRIFGFCFVPNCPVSPEATQSLLEMIGPIRNTHYGGFYDFTSDMASKDTAYTDLALEAHTDTTYFSDPAGLQAFHMLSHTGGEGGKSLLVDGFHAANELLHENQHAYKLLSATGVYSHASGNEDVSIQPHTAFPVLEHDVFYQGHLFRVRWNNSDRAALRLLPWNTEPWYDAAGQFNDILASAQNQYWFQLQPGTPLIFDNWRVLHGRSAFTGKRRMCGAYINHDDFISKYRLTNYATEDVFATTITA